MKKLSTVIILLFIFITFTSCSKDVSLQVPKEKTNEVEKTKETNAPKASEVTSQDEIIKEDTTSENSIIDETEEITEDVTKDPIYYTSFGVLHEIASPYDNPYIIIDEAVFLRGEEAREEALNKGLGYFDENGTYVYLPGYYIRNNYDVLTEYPISDNCTYYLSSWIIQDYLGKDLPLTGLSSDLYEVTFEEFKQISELEDFTLNTWFDCEDGYVVKLYHQYTP